MLPRQWIPGFGLRNPFATNAFWTTGGPSRITLIDASARQESAMKRAFILAITLWLGASAMAHAQVSSPAGTQSNPQTSAQTNAQTNAVSTVTGAIIPSGQGATGATGGSFSTIAPAATPCAFGTSLSANLTAFGCASDPLSAPTYQIPPEAGATPVTMVPTGGGGAQTTTSNATSGAGTGVSSSARCQGAILSIAANAGAGDLFGGIGGC
jgi:hypothetical protein